MKFKLLILNLRVMFAFLCFASVAMAQNKNWSCEQKPISTTKLKVDIVCISKADGEKAIMVPPLAVPADNPEVYIARAADNFANELDKRKLVSLEAKPITFPDAPKDPVPSAADVARENWAAAYRNVIKLEEAVRLNFPVPMGEDSWAKQLSDAKAALLALPMLHSYLNYVSTR